MNMQRVMLTIVGTTVSLMLAMVLISYGKRKIAQAMSRYQVLHMIKVQGMSQEEILNSSKQYGADNQDLHLISTEVGNYKW